MNLSEAINIIQHEARNQDLPFIEFLMEVNKNGIEEYCDLSAMYGELRQDFVLAYRIVMNAGREMFAPV